MKNIIVAGIGTDVGKTVVSAILATMLQADYWKPIESGAEEESDSTKIKELLNPSDHTIHTPSYSLQAPLSPHHAARLEDTIIDIKSIKPPHTERPLVIEMVGGIYVPLTTQYVSCNLFASWQTHWILVSRHYIGSINHTLLTLEALFKKNISLLGIIFNGEPNPDSEEAILDAYAIPKLGHLLTEKTINHYVIQRYAKQWQLTFPLLS